MYFNGEKTDFSTKLLDHLEFYMQRIFLDPYLILYTKYNSLSIIDLNIIDKTIKIVEENIGINLVLDYVRIS